MGWHRAIVADRMLRRSTAAMVLPTSIAEPPPIATTPATRSAPGNGSGSIRLGHSRIALNIVADDHAVAATAQRRGGRVDQPAGAKAGIYQQQDRGAPGQADRQRRAQALERSGTLDNLWNACELDSIHGQSDVCADSSTDRRFTQNREMASAASTKGIGLAAAVAPLLARPALCERGAAQSAGGCHGGRMTAIGTETAQRRWHLQGSQGDRMMDRRRIDRRWLPLNALRAFEAVAKHASFTGAANALRISQSALSRHVISIEKLIGVQLFDRRPHALVLTKAGQHLLPTVIKSLDRLEYSLDEIRNAGAPTLRTLHVQMPPSFAVRLAVPVLRDFRRANPDIEIDLVSPTAWVLRPATWTWPWSTPGPPLPSMSATCCGR